MNKANLQKHVDYCRGVLAGATPSPATFDMGHYYKEYGCGTSACFMGWTAFSFPEYIEACKQKGLVRPWLVVSEELFEIDCSGCTWYFLFAVDWPNDLEQAILRAEYLIEHDTPPENWDYELRL